MGGVEYEPRRMQFTVLAPQAPGPKIRKGDWVTLRRDGEVLRFQVASARKKRNVPDTYVIKAVEDASSSPSR